VVWVSLFDPLSLNQPPLASALSIMQVYGAFCSKCAKYEICVGTGESRLRRAMALTGIAIICRGALLTVHLAE